METIKEQTIAEKIIDTIITGSGNKKGKCGSIYKLTGCWLLKIGKKVSYDNISNLSFELNNEISLAINSAIYSSNKDDIFYDISIIKYVKHQEKPKRNSTKIEDFPQSAFDALVGQIMEAKELGFFPDLKIIPDLKGIGNVLVNYKAESLQLIDPFYRYEIAQVFYASQETNYYQALYEELKRLNGGNDYSGVIEKKLNKAIIEMGFTQYDGPYPYGTVIEEAKNYSQEKIIDLNLQFPSLQEVEPELVSQLLPSISFSKPFSVLEKQLEILDKIIPPYPVCRLASVLACSLEDKPEPMSQQHNTR